MMCALDPGAIPDADSLWEAYQDSVLESGGARKAGSSYADLDSSFEMATMSALTEAVCKTNGVLG